jgi:chromate reductase, NAD(P)H dehydrogenase (quinone)
VLAYLDMPTLGQPEAFITNKEGLLDDQGNVAESSREFLKGWVEKYLAWVTDHNKK